MFFVIEESSWTNVPEDGLDTPTGRAAYVERLESLLDRLDVADERDEGFSTSSELLHQMIAGQPLAEVLWSLPREVTQRLSARFSTLRYWDDELPDFEFEATVDGTAVVSPSLVRVHDNVARGQVFACIVFPGTWSGRHEVAVNGRIEAIHFIADEETHREFFRDALRRFTTKPTDLQKLASHAFPMTCFIDGVWREIRAFAGGYDRVRDALLHFFTVSDDFGTWIFSDDTGRLSPEERTDRSGLPITDSLIMQRFSGWGIEVAPEKPNVAKDSRCRRARERTLDDRILYCEWHFKIEPHENRVHFHRPIPESNERPIVAIFCRHLPLPGD